MNADELKTVLDKHATWIRGEPDGKRADLSRANLSEADLSRANLSRADLSRANLSEADLSGANLSRAGLSEANLWGANLSEADLSGANLWGADLSRANLSEADLSRANLSRADLRGTCLDPELVTLQRKFCRECPPTKHGGRIVYRTARSQHVSDTQYIPGRTYVAPNLSFSCETACHPGIHAGSLEWMRDNYPVTPLVRCYVRDGDWVITAKGAVRCKRIRVLSEVEA